MTDYELTKRLGKMRDALSELHLRDREWFVSKGERRNIKARRAVKREARRVAKHAHRPMWERA